MIWGGAEAVMLALGSSCKYRLPLAERSDCTETIINQLLTDSYQNPISEWQLTIKLHLVAGFIVASELMYFSYKAASGESDTYFSLPIILFTTSVCAFFPAMSTVSATVMVSPQANPSQNELKKNVAGELLCKGGKTQWWDSRRL